jgi:hypothetical protein
LATASAGADQALITFDDLPDSTSGLSIPNGYESLTWYWRRDHARLGRGTGPIVSSPVHHRSHENQLDRPGLAAHLGNLHFRLLRHARRPAKVLPCAGVTLIKLMAERVCFVETLKVQKSWLGAKLDKLSATERAAAFTRPHAPLRTPIQGDRRVATDVCPARAFERRPSRRAA